MDLKLRAARAFCNKLKSIISHCDISDTSMDGSFRVDANISIEGGERTEIKNIGSVKEVEKAIKWEIQRHQQEKRRGSPVKRETRAWNGQKTTLLRSKEYEDDYRYFPDPDLVPFEVTDAQIKKAQKLLPELPDQRLKRFIDQFGLIEYDADVLISEKENADFFEACAKKNSDYKLIVNWINNDIAGGLNDQDKVIKDTKLTPKALLELMDLIKNGDIPIKLGKKFIPDMLQGKMPSAIAKAQNVQKITDRTILEPLCDKIIQDNPQVVESLKKKPKAFMNLVGLVMKETRGQADSELTQKILADKLGFDLSLIEK